MAPLDLWNDSFSKPRLRTIAIEDTTSEDFSGKTRCVIIKPAEVKNVPYVIDVNMNNHYELDPQNVIKALSIIDTNVLNNYSSFERILHNILDKIQ